MSRHAPHLVQGLSKGELAQLAAAHGLGQPHGIGTGALELADVVELGLRGH